MVGIGCKKSFFDRALAGLPVANQEGKISRPWLIKIKKFFRAAGFVVPQRSAVCPRSCRSIGFMGICRAEHNSGHFAGVGVFDFWGMC